MAMRADAGSRTPSSAALLTTATLRSSATPPSRWNNSAQERLADSFVRLGEASGVVCTAKLTTYALTPRPLAVHDDDPR